MSDEGASPTQDSTMGEVVDTRRAITKLHQLALDPRNRPFIANDKGCIKNIIRTLDFPSEDVLYKALETISYLTSHSQQNRDALAKYEVLITKIREVAKMDYCEDVKQLAHFILKSFAPSDCRNQEGDFTLAALNSAAQRKELDVTTRACAPNTIVLRIDGLQDHKDRDRVEKTIIKVKGVINVNMDTCEPGDNWTVRFFSQSALKVRAVIRAKCGADDIISAIGTLGHGTAGFRALQSESEPHATNSPLDGAENANPNQSATGAATPSGKAVGESCRTPMGCSSRPGGAFDSPRAYRHVTPPELAAPAGQGFMRDTAVGLMAPPQGPSWIQRLGRALWW